MTTREPNLKELLAIYDSAETKILEYFNYEEESLPLIDLTMSYWFIDKDTSQVRFFESLYDYKLKDEDKSFEQTITSIHRGLGFTLIKSYEDECLTVFDNSKRINPYDEAA